VRDLLFPTSHFSSTLMRSLMSDSSVALRCHVQHLLAKRDISQKCLNCSMLWSFFHGLGSGQGHLESIHDFFLRSCQSTKRANQKVERVSNDAKHNCRLRAIVLACAKQGANGAMMGAMSGVTWHPDGCPTSWKIQRNDWACPQQVHPLCHNFAPFITVLPLEQDRRAPALLV
jgi:hypothetical protein